MFCKLEKLIKNIQIQHSRITELWQTRFRNDNFNLKKILVVDVFETTRNPEVLKKIFNHRVFLLDILNEYCVKLQNKEIENVECRIKNQNSIESKLATYMGLVPKSDKVELRGEVPLKKCLNDLFGIRFIVKNNNCTLEKVKEFVETKFPELKVIFSKKNGYNAVHVYFQDNNEMFPWELQIWLDKDAINNKNYHYIYKQTYTTWEEDNKKEEFDNE